MEAFALMREELRRVRELNSDLLEALRELVALDELTTTTMGWDETPEVIAARAAIAKAEGRS